MKKLLLLALLPFAVAVHAQDKPKLKDLLFGGKLKQDSTGVIRSTDDLSAKIDTTTKREVVIEKTKTVTTDSPKKIAGNNGDASVETKEVTTTSTVTSSSAPTK